MNRIISSTTITTICIIFIVGCGGSEQEAGINSDTDKALTSAALLASGSSSFAEPASSSSAESCSTVRVVQKSIPSIYVDVSSVDTSILPD